MQCYVDYNIHYAESIKYVQKGLFPLHTITYSKELKSLIKSGQAKGSLNPRWGNTIENKEKTHKIQ